MEAKEFEARKGELAGECCMAPQVLDRVIPRLERFMKPFVDNLAPNIQQDPSQRQVPASESNSRLNANKRLLAIEPIADHPENEADHSGLQHGGIG